MEKSLKYSIKGEVTCTFIVNCGNLKKNDVIWGRINRSIGNRPLEVTDRNSCLLSTSVYRGLLMCQG